MRVAIVNDVRMAVEAMRRVLLSDPNHQVAWVAKDGVEAVARAAEDTPDLILMDLIMPRMDGVEATRRIMAASPCPIVVVTASIAENSSGVFDAMGAGALDAVNTPVLERPGAHEGADALLAKVETIRKLTGPVGSSISPVGLGQTPRAASQSQTSLVAIGASAGGPAALASVLRVLPVDFPAPIVIVQHVDVQFAAGLASWLGSQCPMQVRLAREGDRAEPGTVLLAGKDLHLVFVSPARLSYSRRPHDCSYRPSVDAFFKSAVQFWPGPILGVLLTGMGRDGAEGLRDLRNAGHHTIAQDQASSAVYGMPKAAAELHAASEVLALDKIGARLKNILMQKTKPHA